MTKLYKKIRLEFNEGPTSKNVWRYKWVDNIAQLPEQDCPKREQLGYNKHYYEVIDMNENIHKFRIDVSYKNCSETKITNEKIKECLSKKI